MLAKYWILNLFKLFGLIPICSKKSIALAFQVYLLVSQTATCVSLFYFVSKHFEPKSVTGFVRIFKGKIKHFFTFSLAMLKSVFLNLFGFAKNLKIKFYCKFCKKNSNFAHMEFSNFRCTLGSLVTHRLKNNG